MTSCEKCRICGERNIVEHGEENSQDKIITGYRCYICKGINALVFTQKNKNIVLGYDPAEA